ncbi:MAG: MFS transporter [Anaerolineaceae bacterium]
MTAEVQNQLPKDWLKRFLVIWSGQAFSILGSQLVSFALVWWMTKETGSALVLAASSTMIYLPRVLLGPFIGALIDRWNRRWVIILSDAGVAAATVLLAVLFWTGAVQLWHIYVLIFIRSLGGIIHFPAMESSMILMVPERHLPRIAGLNHVLNGGVSILGPALGALLMETLPMQGVLAIDVVTAFLAISPLFFIRIPQPVHQKPVDHITPRVVLQDVADGFRYLVGYRGLIMTIWYAILLNFILTPTGSFLPLLVTQHFNGGVWHLGLLESVSGVGMISGGLLLSIWGGFKRRIWNTIVAVGVLGFTILLIGSAPASAFPFVVGLVFIRGMSGTVMDGSIISIMQGIIRPDMQGRVFSLLLMAGGITSPLGLMVAGPVAERFGVQSWYIFCGSVAVILGLISPFCAI